MAEFQYVRPTLYPKQNAAIFCAARYGVVEASTKAGKTAGCMVWLLEQAIRGKAGQNFWWVAPIRDQAKIVFRRLKRSIPAETYTANETELTITLKHGATLWFKGADHPDSLYGDDVRAAVIDEATRVKQEAWHAVRSTLTATGGPLRIIGNVKGRKNWAYQLARKAEAGEADMHYAKLTAYDAVEAGVLKREEIENAKALLPERVFRELYLAEPADDGGNPFGLDAIAACVGPMSSRAPVAFGIDLAKSVDWTVPAGLDEDGALASFDRFQKPWEATIDRLVDIIGSTPTLVDSTGVGDPVLESLQVRSRPIGRVEGYKFSAQSKQKLMEGLAIAIHRKAVRFPDNSRECPIRSELEAFEYVVKPTHVQYSAPEGQHDDCVCALALAVEHLRNATHRVPFSAQFFG